MTSRKSKCFRYCRTGCEKSAELAEQKQTAHYVDAAEAAEEGGVTSTEDSPAGVAETGADKGEPEKARTAACAAADAAFSIASFNDPCTIHCTWVDQLCGSQKPILWRLPI